MESYRSRVLVVDKAPMLRRQVSQVLKNSGFDIKTVENGPLAMEMLDAEQFDVVVSDIRVSNGDGRLFCLDLLQLNDHPPVIILTEAVQPRIIETLKSQGAADFCLKPIDYSLLVLKIKNLVSHLNTIMQQTESIRSNLESKKLDSSDSSNDLSTVQNVEAADTANVEELDPTDLGVDASQAKQVATILMKDGQRCEALVEKLLSVDVEAVAVQSPDELFQLLNEQRIDRVIVEHELEGSMTGMEILKRLAADQIRAEVILLADPSEKIKMLARTHRAKTVIDAHTDLDEIVKVVVGLDSNEKKRTESIPFEARRLVQDFEGIPPLPQLILKLLGYMSMPLDEIPIKELSNDISCDPKAISELLKLTNSSSMGLRRKVAKVNDAVALLGPKRTISLIVASATVSSQAKLLKGWSEELRKWYHKRSVLIASTATTFAERLEDISPDTAFVVGLLQEIGILVFAKQYGDRYSAIIQRSREVGQLQLHHLEEREFKFSHAEISAALLQKWKFPNSLIDPILDHHRSEYSRERSQLESCLMHTMRIGEALANLSDFPHPLRQRALNELLSKYGDETSEKCTSCLTEAVARTSESCRLFSLPAPDPEEMKKLVETATAPQEESVSTS